MKRVISLILAVALVACFCIVPVTADEGAPKAKLTAKLSGEEVPQAGNRFIVTVALEEISSNLLTSASVYFNWPREVASLVKFSGTDATPLEDSFGVQALGNIADRYSEDEGTGKFVRTFDAKLAEDKIVPGYANYVQYIHQNAIDQTPAKAENGYYKLFDIAFVLNQDYTYDDFYFTFDDESSAYLVNTKLPEDEQGGGSIALESKVSDGNITVEGISAKEEVKYESVGGQGSNYEGVYALPKVITTEGTVKFNLAVGSSDNVKDSMIGLSKGEMITNSNYFANTAALTLIGSTKSGSVLGYHDGSNRNALVDDANFEFDTNYSVEIGINNTAKTWSIKIVKDGGETLAEKSDISMRYKEADVIDSIILCENGGGGAGGLVVTNLVVETNDEQPTVPSEPETQAPSEDESGTEAPSEDETTPSEPETQAPSEPVTIPEDAIVASKTDSIDVTAGKVGYSDAAERREDFKDSDAMFTASWGNDRFGEMVFEGIQVGEGQAIIDAQLTLVPGEIMNATDHVNDFYVIAIDPAQFGTIRTLLGADRTPVYPVVGTGDFGAAEEALTVDLDLTNYFDEYPDADSVALAIVSKTNGLFGVYGASFGEKAPYLVVEVGEAPTEPESTPSEPETTPSEPESTPSEPESTPSEPESQPGTEPEEPTKPADAVDSVKGQNEDAIHNLDVIITDKGTVTFKFVATDTATETLIAITNKAQMLTDGNYYANAGVQLGITGNGTVLRYRPGDASQWLEETAAIVPGETYTVEVALDIAAQTWDAVVTDEAGETVLEVKGAALRVAAPISSVDSIVMLDNGDSSDGGYFFDVQVDGGVEPTPDILPLVGEATTQGNAVQGTFTINEAYVGDDTPAEGEEVVYVISWLKDGKATSATATPIEFKDGKVEQAGQFALDDGMDGVVTYAISVLTDVESPLEALIKGNLGTPVGSVKGSLE